MGQPRPRTLAESINATLDELLAADRRVIVFGEDVGVKGGVYGVTAVWPAGMARLGCSTHCSTSRPFSVLGWAPASPD